MLTAVRALPPLDIAICAAAVADWRVDQSDSKLKKTEDGTAPHLHLIQNPDILATISQSENRPNLVIGFAAETEDLYKNAETKFKKKGCDWIIANEVSEKKGFNATNNKITIIKGGKVKEWPSLSKLKIAEKLVLEISEYFSKVEKGFLCQK